MSEYEVVPEPPDLDSYMALRTATGLTQRTRHAAEVGLAGTWFGVHVVHRDRVVGMGRLIGDGGLYFHVVDIAVSPDHQRRGLGSKIVGALMDRLREDAPATAQVTLMADGTAYRLYEKFGFEATAPESIGMLLQL